MASATQLLRRALVLILLMSAAAHASTAAVRNADIHVLLDVDGSALVTESYQFIGGPQQIERTIPLRRDLEKRERPFVIDVVRVQSDQGTPLDYSARRRADSVVITFTPVDRSATLTYWVRNAARMGGDRDWLFWTATDGTYGYGSATVRVTLPIAMAERFAANAYLRPLGEPGTGALRLWSNSGGLPGRIDRNTFEVVAPGTLVPGVQVLVDVSMPKGILQERSAFVQGWWYVEANPIVLLPLVTLAVVLLVRRWRSRDIDVRRAIAVRYEPPEGLSPAEAGALIDDRIDPRDVAATLVDLAVRGYIHIQSTEPKKGQPDYRLDLLKPSEEWGGLRAHERTILFHTFYGGYWTELSSLRLRFPSLVPTFAKDVMRALNARGMYRRSPKAVPLYGEASFAAVVLLLLLANASGLVVLFDSGWAAAVSILASAALVVALVPRPTPKSKSGLEQWREIRGFQQFLEAVDADRLQRMTPDLFERYLPYAMALGVESSWTAAFDDVAIPVPEWFGADGGLVDFRLFGDSIDALCAQVLAGLRPSRRRGNAPGAAERRAKPAASNAASAG